MIPTRSRMRDEAGFSVVESVMALTIVFGVLLGLLGGLTAGIRGVVTGRQRGTALALANEVLEQARGRNYAEVGHDLDSDPTLAGDPLLTGTASARSYTGVSPAEPLVASTVDAGAAAATLTNALFPFSPHTWTTKREGSTYTTTVYVTRVTPAAGDAYKRITVKVIWSPSQYATAARTVTLSTFLFDVVPPPDPRLIGQAEADSGSFVITGALSSVALSEALFRLPYVTGIIDSGFVRGAKGFASTARSSVILTSGTPAGCVVDGSRADCPGGKAETGADNDSGTAPPETDRVGPLDFSGGVVAAGTALSATLGGGAAQAFSTARSCWACPGSSPGPDDDDRLPYQWGRATGPAGMSIGFATGSVEGRLLSAATGCTGDCAAVALDRDEAAGSARLRSSATAAYPAADLVTFTSGAPAGYAGMIRIGSAGVSASAESGPGAAAPSTTGAPVTVQLYNNAGGYTAYQLTPGDAAPPVDPTAHAAFTVNGAQVSMDATVHWNPKVVSSVSGGGAVTASEASLTNWLFVEVRLVITEGSNVTDLVLHMDYGRISARASYEAV